jgi:hypothetical protein
LLWTAYSYISPFNIHTYFNGCCGGCGGAAAVGDASNTGNTHSFDSSYFIFHTTKRLYNTGLTGGCGSAVAVSTIHHILRFIYLHFLAPKLTQISTAAAAARLQSAMLPVGFEHEATAAIVTAAAAASLDANEIASPLPFDADKMLIAVGAMRSRYIRRKLNMYSTLSGVGVSLHKTCVVLF